MKTTIIVVMTLVIGGIVAHTIYEPRIEYVKEYVAAPTIEQLTAERAAAIMATVEFQEEINAIANARALYQLSIEKQDIAVELSELAMLNFKRSKELAEQWTNSTLNLSYE